VRSREAAKTALFSLISGAYAWQNVPSRRLLLWPDVPKETRPAFFQFEGGKTNYKWTNGFLPVRTLEAKLFVYLDSSDHTLPAAIVMDAVMDAIDAALAPAGADIIKGKQTLGGTCDWCRIDGDTTDDPGDIDDDGLLIIPIKITLP
jgi:hypothetical protein